MDKNDINEEQEARADLYRKYEYEQELQDKHFYYKDYSERFKKANMILELLKVNARLKLSEISKITGIPISTIFDIFNSIINKDFIFITKRKQGVKMKFSRHSWVNQFRKIK